MPVVHIKGRVLPSLALPSAVQITIDNLPQLEWVDANGGQTFRIITRIKDSVIDVEFDVTRYDDAAREEIFKRAWDLARAAVDIYCFSVGWGLTVYLDTIVAPDGSQATILPKNEALAAYFTAFDVSPQNTAGPNNLDAFYRLLVSDPPLFMALNDLIVSITLPHHATVNCARAIEGLRVLMIPATDRRQAWPIFQTNLNIDRAYREYVTDISTGPRHGDRTFIPGTIVNETVKRSWIIMNRFLEYRKTGNQQLPLAQFPLLTG
jgi:hypothetical protein